MKEFYSIEEIKEKYDVEGHIKAKHMEKYMVKLIRDTGATSCKVVTGPDEERGCRIVTGLQLEYKK